MGKINVGQRKNGDCPWSAGPRDVERDLDKINQRLKQPLGTSSMTGPHHQVDDDDEQ